MLVASTGAAVAVALAMPVAASAEPYPAAPPAASVSAGTVAVNGAVTFSGSGFAAGEEITLEVNYGAGKVVVGHAIADANGSFSASVQLSQAGNAVLTATGTRSGVVATSNVTVVAASAADATLPTATSPTSTLPTTGMSGQTLATEIGVASVAIVAGGTLIGFTLRRRRTGTPAQ